MARSLTCTPILLLMLVCFLYAQISAATAAGPETKKFIKASCNVTLYRKLCVESITPYASKIQESHRKLAFTAVAVSVKRGQSMINFLKKLAKTSGLKPKEHAALKDCLEEVNDVVDQLTKSLDELKYYGSEFESHLNNLQTWVSAALTDASTCADGFAGRALDGNAKNFIKREMSKVTQATSNALALCNTLG